MSVVLATRVRGTHRLADALYGRVYARVRRALTKVQIDIDSFTKDMQEVGTDAVFRIDLTPTEQALREQVLPLLWTVYQKSLRLTLRSVKRKALSKAEIDPSVFQQVSPLALEWAQKSGAMIEGITEETRKAVATLIHRGFAEGIPPRELAKYIGELGLGLNSLQASALYNLQTKLVGQGLGPSTIAKRVERAKQQALRLRSEMIARTETMASANAGQLDGWHKANAEGLVDSDLVKEWIAADPCPICEKLDQEQRPLTEYFSNGTQSPPAHPMCRCVMGLAEPRESTGVGVGPGAAVGFGGIPGAGATAVPGPSLPKAKKPKAKFATDPAVMKQIAALQQQGLSGYKIAKQLGVYPSQVYSALKKLDTVKTKVAAVVKTPVTGKVTVGGVTYEKVAAMLKDPATGKFRQVHLNAKGDVMTTADGKPLWAEMGQPTKVSPPSPPAPISTGAPTSSEAWPINDSVARRTGTKYLKEIRDAHKAWLDKLSNSELSALKQYTGESYRDINRYLRSPETFPAGRTGRKRSLARSRAKRVQDALNKAPTPPPPELVWRGQFQWPATYKPGDVVALKGFQSTSVSPATARTWSRGRTLLEIKPKRGGYVERVSSHALEREYLLPHNAQYKIIGRKSVLIGNEQVEVIQLEML